MSRREIEDDRGQQAGATGDGWQRSGEEGEDPKEDGLRSEAGADGEGNTEASGRDTVHDSSYRPGWRMSKALAAAVMVDDGQSKDPVGGNREQGEGGVKR